MIKCNQLGCEEMAVVEYVWPTTGDTKRSCAEHALKAKQVLAAIGFGLSVKPIAGEAHIQSEDDNAK